MFIGNKKLYLTIALTILNVLGWNRTEIWRSEGIFTFVWKIFEIWRPEELFSFVLTFLFEDPPKEEDKEKAVEKEEG